MKAKTNEKAPGSCQNCAHWDEIKDRVRVKQVLTSTLAKIEAKLKAKTYKPSLADYLKLMQLEKDFGEEDAREIRVTWVEPGTTSDGDK